MPARQDCAVHACELVSLSLCANMHGFDMHGLFCINVSVRCIMHIITLYGAPVGITSHGRSFQHSMTSMILWLEQSLVTMTMHSSLVGSDSGTALVEFAADMRPSKLIEIVGLGGVSIICAMYSVLNNHWSFLIVRLGTDARFSLFVFLYKYITHHT